MTHSTFWLNLDKSNWELLVESVLPSGAAATLELGPFGVTPEVTFVDENVEGVDMTWVCRRGNRNAFLCQNRINRKWLVSFLVHALQEIIHTWCRSSCGWDWPLTPLLTNSLKAPGNTNKLASLN